LIQTYQMRVTGNKIRFVFIDKANDTIVVSRWLMMVAPMMGVSDITLRRHFQNEDGTIKPFVERNGCYCYRLVEHKEKKTKGNAFLYGAADKIKIIKNIFHAKVKQPKKRGY